MPKFSPKVNATGFLELLKLGAASANTRILGFEVEDSGAVHAYYWTKRRYRVHVEIQPVGVDYAHVVFYADVDRIAHFLQSYIDGMDLKGDVRTDLACWVLGCRKLFRLASGADCAHASTEDFVRVLYSPVSPTGKYQLVIVPSEGYNADGDAFCGMINTVDEVLAELARHAARQLKTASESHSDFPKLNDAEKCFINEALEDEELEP